MKQVYVHVGMRESIMFASGRIIEPLPVQNTHLRTSGDAFKGYNDGLSNETLDWLGPVARINVFVGATNTGKSRFMRALARNERYMLVSHAATGAVDVILGTCERWKETTQSRRSIRMGRVVEPWTGSEAPYLQNIIAL